MRLARPLATAAATTLAAGLLPLALMAPAQAAPTCYDPVPLAACGGRVVAQPERSVSFHQFEGQVESLERTLRAIEKRSPGFLEVKTAAQWTGDNAHKSNGGRAIWVVRITDESVSGPKKQVAASLSVHGLEAAGREGGLRWLEDVAMATSAVAAGIDAPMHAGKTAVPTSEVMRRTETWVAFTNPDGWAAGDVKPGTTGFARGSANGKDLNRDFPTVGWMDRNGGRGVAGSEPETRAWISIVENLDNLKTSTDIHGELTTPNEAFSDLIIPAGQWTPTRQAQVNQLSAHIIDGVERKFASEGVVLDQVFGPLPSGDGATPRRPANVAASYDIVGYDDSGFMGDWFSQRQDSVHMDIENFLSNLAPNNAYSGLVEQTHVAAVRGILEALVVEALLTDDVKPTLAMKRVAYVDDGVRTTSADGVGRGADAVEGETQVPYDVSRLEYFEVLERETGRPVDAVSGAAVAAGTVGSSYDTLVVDDLETVPGVSTAAFVAGLGDFARNGGQLLLTDRAVKLLDDLGVVPSSALTVNRTDAGHVDFLAPLGDHPWEQGLVGKPSQTYYEVMLGFPSRNSAPNYGVTRTVWEAAGGKTVATVGAQNSSSSPNTALGSIPFGQGSVALFGAILPQAIEELVREDGTRTVTPHPFGLADYAVTITGGQVLDNVLSYSRTAAAGTATLLLPSSPTSAPALVGRGTVDPDEVLRRSLRVGATR